MNRQPAGRQYLLCDIKLLVNVVRTRAPRRLLAVLALATAAAVVTVLVSRGTQRAIVPASAPAGHQPFTVIRDYPHDPRAFTQGLIYSDGFLYRARV